jgi:hypothetical protein
LVFWVQSELGHTPALLASDAERIIERAAPGSEVREVKALETYRPRSKALRREERPGELATVDGAAAPVEVTVDYRGTDSHFPWITHSGSPLMAGAPGNSCPVGAEWVLQEAHDHGTAPPPEKGTIEKAEDAAQQAADAITDAARETAESAKTGAALTGGAIVIGGALWLLSKLKPRRARS